MRNFDEADRIRDELRAKGVSVDDRARTWSTSDGRSGALVSGGGFARGDKVSAHGARICSVDVMPPAFVVLASHSFPQWAVLTRISSRCSRMDRSRGRTPSSSRACRSTRAPRTLPTSSEASVTHALATMPHAD
eukprot:656340-Pleurochrysis_carterae.AAC.1